MTTSYMLRRNPAEGKEEDYIRRHTDVHLPPVLQIEGFETVQCFRLSEQQMQAQAHRYLTIYGINGEDIRGTLENLRNMTSLTMSDSLDLSTLQISIFAQV